MKIDACGNSDKLNSNKIQLPTKRWELTRTPKVPVTPLKTNTETEQTDAVTPSLRSELRSLNIRHPHVGTLENSLGTTASLCIFFYTS